jgi:hypothetical protein
VASYQEICQKNKDY